MSRLEAGGLFLIRDLAGRFKVSPMPVVEAIRRLERDGFVDGGGAKGGTTVKEWSCDVIAEAYHIRRALEGQAIELFVKQGAKTRIRDRPSCCRTRTQH